MKKLLLIYVGFSFVFLLSGKTLVRSQIPKDYQSETLRSISDLLLFKADAFKIEKDTMSVNTNKDVKKVKKENSTREDSTSIEFVGSSEMQKAISNNSEIPANAGIGVRFTKIYGSPTKWIGITKLELDLSISITLNY